MARFKTKLEAAIRELPGDWNALWLNGTETRKGFPISKHLKHVKEMWGTFGYVVNSSFYDFVIEGLGKELKSADGFYTKHQFKNKVYATIQPLVKHREGYSEISHAVVERYKHLA